MTSLLKLELAEILHYVNSGTYSSKRKVTNSNIARDKISEVKAELLQVGISFGTQFLSLGIFISKKVGF